MRFDTHQVRVYLMNRLLSAGMVLDAWDDGTDLIMAMLRTGVAVTIHLIESRISLAEVKSVLTQNHAAGFHTMFIFWCDMLLPREGDEYPMDDWMAGLMPLYGDVLYGYEVFHGSVYVFPVYFDGIGGVRTIRYGDDINISGIGGRTVNSAGPYLTGMWRVAGFNMAPGTKQTRGEAQAEVENEEVSAGVASLSAYYAILELEYSADKDAIKVAYRRMARKYHPDMNKAPDAAEHMKRVNIAYYHIMQQLAD